MDTEARENCQLFTSMMGKIKEHLEQQDSWQHKASGEAPNSSFEIIELIAMGTCREFHFKWSALQLIDSLPLDVKGAKLTSEQMFGDGLYWGGKPKMTLHWPKLPILQWAF